MQTEPTIAAPTGSLDLLQPLPSVPHGRVHQQQLPAPPPSCWSHRCREPRRSSPPWPARWSSMPPLSWLTSMSPAAGNGADSPDPPPSTSPIPLWTRRTSPPCPGPASASSRGGRRLCSAPSPLPPPPTSSGEQQHEARPPWTSSSGSSMPSPENASPCRILGAHSRSEPFRPVPTDPVSMTSHVAVLWIVENLLLPLFF